MTVPVRPEIATARRLMAMQGRDGLWGAFRLTPGESRDWVGAVAACALAEAAGSGRLPPPLAAAARGRAARTAAVLRERERPGGGWGYNASVPPDCDSTAAVLRLFAALGQPAPPASVGFLAAQGSPATGWPTYPPMRRWDRWSQPCAEVDAAAGLALAVSGVMGGDELATLWRDRLAPAQGADGHWAPYWWPGPGVATLAAIQLWAAAGRPDPAPALPAPARAGLSALDALTLAHAAFFIQPDAGHSAVEEATARMSRPGRWPADTVLLAPPRFAASPSGEASPEGRGVLTAAAALRALTAVPTTPKARPRAPSQQVPDATASVATGLARLADTLGLSPAAAALAGVAGAALLRPLLTARLPWPNRAVSNLARGWPVEFSATLDPDNHPALRLAADLGDPRLSPGARARVARASLIETADTLGLDPAPLQAALSPLVAAMRRADPGERFGLWAGLDLTDGPQGPQPVLKAYANLARGGTTPAERLVLAARALGAIGIPAGDLMRLDAALGGAGQPQQMGIALAPGGRLAVKVYWELPAFDAAATARLAEALDLPLPPGFGPEIPGLASLGDALRGLSGLAVRLDPARGLRRELTLATQAARGIGWLPGHEVRALDQWAAGFGLSAAAARALTAALRSDGPATRSLHTLTFRHGEPLRAAVYFHADGWLSRRLAPAAAPAALPSFPPRSRDKEECHVHSSR